MVSPHNAPNAKPIWAHLDLRSLAVFRVALGCTLVLDVVTRLGHITEFYTDDGVLPRLLLSHTEFIDDWLCFHLGVGHWFGIFCLLMLQGAFAAALALGWRTKLMTIGCWFLLNSLHTRNPFVNDRGDLELVLLLFWSAFLPLGAAWSLDAKAGRRDWGSDRGPPAAAYVLQIAQIYLFAGFLKYGDFWLARGDGLFHSLQSPLFATDLGFWLATAPFSLLKAMNYAVIAGEIFGGLLLLSPVSVEQARMVAVPMLALFHIAVFLLFNLGLFPLIGIVGLLPLIPSSFWESVPRKFHPAEKSVTEDFRSIPLWSKYALTLSIFLAALSNLTFRPDGESLQRPAILVGLSRALALQQHWELFSPLPPYNGYFEIHTTDPPATIRTPSEVEFRSHRWKMLMVASLYPRFAFLRRGILTHLADSPDSGRYEFHVKLVDAEGKSKQAEIWVLFDGPVSGMKT